MVGVGICHATSDTQFVYRIEFKNPSPPPLLAFFPTLSPLVFKALTTTRIAVFQGTEINAEVRHGRNALHYAADAGKVPIVRFLLENMAIIDVRDCFFFLSFCLLLRV